MRAILIAAGLLMLGGCSLSSEYRALKVIAAEGVKTAIQDKKDHNDLKGEVVLALPCDASLGAVMRLKDARKRAILIELCGGPSADSQVTVDDLASLMRALDRTYTP